MKFIDEVKVFAHAGSGGNGIIHWRREKYVPKGGPDGGDGGDGGAVIFVADSSKSTLLDLSYNPIIKAESGSHGDGNNKSGKSGENYYCHVPIGTQIFYNEQLVADLKVDGSTWVAAKGGKGGLGNTNFKTSTRQAPKFAQLGQEGESFEFHLVLKSVADVGLVGFPNAGKSTLVATLSAATPKIADYPFTTLMPSLGVVEVDDHNKFVIADIPGLIEGAHTGKGLGIRFLKHIERTKVLAHLIDLSEFTEDELSNEDVVEKTKQQFLALDNELKAFSDTVYSKKRLVVFSKSDIELNVRALKLTKNWFTERGLETHLISSQTRSGINSLKKSLLSYIRS